MDLLENHIEETRDKFREIKVSLSNIEGKIDGLTEFKVKSIVEARTISFIVSATCGFITLASTIVVAYYAKK